MQADVPVSSYEHPPIWCLRGSAVHIFFVQGPCVLLCSLLLHRCQFSVVDIHMCAALLL